MGTKNNPGEFDCYANAEPDEPMFVLLGRDKHAPTLVWLWATLRELDGESPEKVAEARECVTAMIEWAYSHNRKSVGLGAATMAGLFEMMRTINHLVKDSTTDATGIDVVRAFLAASEFEKAEPAS